MARLKIVCFFSALSCSLATGAQPWDASAVDRELELQFTSQVRPFLKTYCHDCHGEPKPKASFDLSPYDSAASVVKDLKHWKLVLEKLEANEMPPDDAPVHPSGKQRRAVIEWVRAVRTDQAQRHAGDPGPVLARRLSNAEYNYTIRDLTGVDIRPTREFPIDPTNEAGFDNSGESLAMSPALLKKYLSAARYVADHVVLKPNGFIFAPHAAVTDADRDKVCVRRIVDFYEKQRIDYANYFFAAWRYKHRDLLRRSDDTLADFAAEESVSSKYLATIWSILTEDGNDVGALGRLNIMWRELPIPLARAAKSDTQSTESHAIERSSYKPCAAMRDFVLRERKQLTIPVGDVEIKGPQKGSQPVILWKNRQIAAHRRRAAQLAESDGENSAEQAANDRFCAVFPDAFFVSERGRMYLAENEQNKGRLLSAGFHLMLGYFRDDRPLRDLVLDEASRRELDELWNELDFVTQAPMRQFRDFVFFERAEPPRFMEGEEFDFARSEDHDVFSEGKMQRLREVYVEKLRRIGTDAGGIEAVETYFDEMNRRVRWVEEQRRKVEPSHLTSLLTFAEKAYRRPLAPSERDGFMAFYRELRTVEMLSHEDAIRDVVVNVLMSPHFCYRFDLPSAGKAAQPLAGYSLASRLSYFLWSTMPDEELFAQAAAGNLQRSEILRAQTKRMLIDPRVRGLATEFGGNWLGFRYFQQHNSVDRGRFESFTDELRDALFEEPIRFFMDAVHHDRSILEFLYATHTFVNSVLARHYGMPNIDVASNPWSRVEEAQRYGRGGLLPMSVFLTVNSHPLRTSPVKRGYWLVRRVLGEHIPAPPPDVPELPRDEAELRNRTLPELLAEHREIKSCAACHDRFDSFGIAFEGYGPIGQRREKDLGGRPIDARATFPDGSKGDALAGLLRYLRDQREDDFVDNLCRKLLVYALGRSLLLSDDSLIEEMKAKLKENGHRVSTMVNTIVTSPQFLNQRGIDYNTEP